MTTLSPLYQQTTYAPPGFGGQYGGAGNYLGGGLGFPGSPARNGFGLPQYIGGFGGSFNQSPKATAFGGNTFGFGGGGGDGGFNPYGGMMGNPFFQQQNRSTFNTSVQDPYSSATLGLDQARAMEAQRNQQMAQEQAQWRQTNPQQAAQYDRQRQFVSSPQYRAMQLGMQNSPMYGQMFSGGFNPYGGMMGGGFNPFGGMMGGGFNPFMGIGGMPPSQYYRPQQPQGGLWSGHIAAESSGRGTDFSRPPAPIGPPIGGFGGGFNQPVMASPSLLGLLSR